MSGEIFTDFRSARISLSEVKITSLYVVQFKKEKEAVRSSRAIDFAISLTLPLVAARVRVPISSSNQNRKCPSVNASADIRRGKAFHYARLRRVSPGRTEAKMRADSYQRI